MQRARSGDAARKNLAALRDELLQRLHVLEVDVLDLLHAELADALAAIEELLLAALLAARPAAAIVSAAARTARSTSLHRRSHLSLLLMPAAPSRRRSRCRPAPQRERERRPPWAGPRGARALSSDCAW